MIYLKSSSTSLTSIQVLAKFAQMIYVISELLDSKELGSAALDRLKEAFARFKNNTQDEPLVYECE